MIFFDTETCGLHGPIVLLQWAEDDGPVNLHSVWKETVDDTLELMHMMLKKALCCFNMSFDAFHFCQTLTTLLVLREDGYGDYCPEDCIDEYAIAEEEARNGPCAKPVSVLDLMLFARRGPFQRTMPRKPIYIRKVPKGIAPTVCEHLENTVKLDSILFAKNKRARTQWSIREHKDRQTGQISINFVDIVLSFNPSTRLKDLAAYALNVPVTHFNEIAPTINPVEEGYAPFALANGRPGNWKGTWPQIIHTHIRHWAYDTLAREYAAQDVIILRDLYKYFGSPEPDDVSSILAWMVGAVRWRGYKVDIPRLKQLRDEAAEKALSAPKDPRKTMAFLAEMLSPVEKIVMQGSTAKPILEILEKKTIPCNDCKGLGCNKCKDGKVEHPVASRAKLVIEARRSQYLENLYNKLIKAGRFHASFEVIGTLSSRMAGGDDLNAQGIPGESIVRQCFPLAFEDSLLCGGDFDAFEVSLAEAVYEDPVLRKDLENGVSIHAIFGMGAYKMTYDEILKTKGQILDLYTRAKSGVFLIFYGGQSKTLAKTLGVEESQAEEAHSKLFKRYHVMGKKRREFANSFCSMRQPNGIGTKVTWADPAEYIESMFGFRRYFTIENQVCKSLFDLANKPPEFWSKFKEKVTRRDREQTAYGAALSALYAAAFNLQAKNMRAAGNHIIQSPGGDITKGTQAVIWETQPAGVHEWRVQPFNVHDEIMCPVHPDYTEMVKEKVNAYISTMKSKVRFLAMDWKIGLKSWGEK